MANYERSAVLNWQAFLCRKLGWAASLSDPSKLIGGLRHDRQIRANITKVAQLDFALPTTLSAIEGNSDEL
jgi:hypothetical protein